MWGVISYILQGNAEYKARAMGSCQVKNIKNDALYYFPSHLFEVGAETMIALKVYLELRHTRPN